MSKSFFRFLRGEINGFYLNSFYRAIDGISKDVYDVLAQKQSTVFKNPSEVTEGECPISKEDIRGIGIIAGIFPVRVTQQSFNGSLRFTVSNIVNEKEYSERGFWKIDTESFTFKRTDDTAYTDDINILKTLQERTSLVESGAEVKGYIPEGVKVLNDDGTIDHSKILSEPPTDKAYSEYYGDEYLYLPEFADITNSIVDSVYLDVIKAMQWVRYNGASITSLFKFISIICPDFVKIHNFDWSGYAHCVVDYSINKEVVVEYKLVRTEVLKLLLKYKFPQFVFNEVEAE